MLLQLESNNAVFDVEDLFNSKLIKHKIINNIGCGHAILIDDKDSEKISKLLIEKNINFNLRKLGVNSETD
jgi:hypothetical protein